MTVKEKYLSLKRDIYGYVKYKFINIVLSAKILKDIM